jgi:polysaccharide export outer membrane protein
MKAPCVLVLLAVLFAAVPVERAGAQVPFTSTSPPNSNPFNSSSNSGFGPMRSAQAPVQNPPVGQSAYPPAPLAQTAYSSAPINPDHKLGPGDRLTFSVQEDRDDKVTQLIVTDSGEVNVPLLGRVKAAGKSSTQLSAEIKAGLEREYYYHATVIMGLDSVAPEASRGRVFINGAVRSQGAIDLPAGTTLTVSQAVAQCGGMTDFADSRKVKIVRKGGPKKGIIVNVKAVQNGETDKDIVVEPGDLIIVPEKMLNVSF